MTDAELLALAEPALKRDVRGGRVFRQAPHDEAHVAVKAKDVRRLVDAGLLVWVNRCRTAARPAHA